MIELVLGDEHIEECIQLIQEYNAGLGVDLSFQNYDQEIHDLKSKYGYPTGRIYLAYEDGKLAGIIALHPLFDHDCEMKRFFVRKEFRHHGIGRVLVEKLLEEAKEMSFEYMYLDTLSTLESACHTYERYGFELIDPYYYNPLENVLYYRKKL